MSYMTNLYQLNAAVSTLHRVADEAELRASCTGTHLDQAVRDFAQMAMSFTNNIPLMTNEEEATMPDFAKTIISLTMVAAIMEDTWTRMQTMLDDGQSVTHQLVDRLLTEAQDNKSDFMQVQFGINELQRGDQDDILEAMQTALAAIHLVY